MKIRVVAVLIILVFGAARLPMENALRTNIAPRFFTRRKLDLDCANSSGRWDLSPR